MNKWLTIFAILFAILSGALFVSSSASAVSPSDDVVRVVDELILDYGTGTENISTNWLQQAEQALRDRGKNTDADNMINTIGDPANSWAVIQNGDNEIYVIWSTGKTTEFSFYLDDYLVSNGQLCQTRGMTWSPVADKLTHPSTSVQCYNSSNTVWFGNNAAAPGIFILNYPMTYPVGYEGEIIPDTYTPPTPPLTWTPDVNMVNVIDWKITLQDKNFNTFDNVPFTCDQGLTPVIQYDLYNNDVDPNTPIDQGTFSPTVPFDFQSENYGVETEYKFIGNYYCGSGENEPSFSGQTTYYFTVNSAGTYVPPTDSCYTDTFPYIDMNGCTGVIEDLLNNLSFGAITFPDWSIENDGCHNLGIIGDWLNVPSSSRTICPQFPATVRNIVTPFLTFILGLTILGVIVTKSRSDTH